MEKLVVSRCIFDDIIGDHFRQNLGNDYEFLLKAQETLEIRKAPKTIEGLDTVYMDFGGSLDTARAFSDMYGVPRKQIVLARDWRKLEGRRAYVKPVNQDYFWSLLNWNHKNHTDARTKVYQMEARNGSAD